MSAPEFIDGFDNYSTAADMVNGIWSTSGSTSTRGPSTNLPRTGPRSLAINPSSNFGGFQRVINGSSKYYVGVAEATTDINSSAQIRLQTNAGKNMSIERSPSTGIMNLRYNGVVVWSSSSQLVFQGTYYFHEFFVDLVAGEMEYRFNGSPMAQVTGLAQFPAEQFVSLHLLAGNNSQFVYYDDVYVHPSKFLGAHRCFTLYADGDSTPQDWTGILSPNYANLNSVPYSPANYIAGNNVGDTSQFVYDHIIGAAASVTINGARINTVQSLDSSGSGETQAGISLDGGSSIIRGIQRPLSTSDVFYADMVDVSGFSLAEINLGEIFIERMA